ncbi:MAG: DUF935 family protein [Opitutales bacterium]|nr:DUF935 family protein [Opitutales bacterium]
MPERPPTIPVIRPHSRDARLAGIPVDFSPDTLRWLLDEGARGDIMLQNELFDTMEDTWARLRTNLNKCKRAITRLSWEVQPHAPGERKPTDTAAEKAAFVKELLSHQRAALWEDQHDFDGTVYALMDAIARGISVLEIDWDLVDGYYIPVGTRTVPSTSLGFEMQNHMPGGLRLFPDRDRTKPRRFEEYPHKFLVGIYRGKGGHIAKTAQLRALAPYWLGRMLGWEWMAHRAELFGLPIRWANYPADLDDAEIQRLASMIENMGTAAWGIFPQGVDLKLQSGAISGVAGANEPTERLMNIADRACDLIFIGQTLTSQSDGVGSYAMARVHRDVELDHYESYASYVAKVINSQLLPSIIELNWGSAHEVPEFQFNLPRVDHENDKVRRDKILFKDMGLPVARAWLYERHRVPPPAPEDDLFLGDIPDAPAPHGGEAAARPAASVPSMVPGGAPSGLGAGLDTATPAGGGGEHSAPPENGGTEAKAAAPCGCAAPVDARSESSAELEERKAVGRKHLEVLKARAAAEGKTIYWDNPMDERTSEECQARHGKAYGDGWTDPPPIHHNCRSTMVLR